MTTTMTTDGQTDHLTPAARGVTILMPAHACGKHELVCNLRLTWHEEIEVLPNKEQWVCCPLFRCYPYLGGSPNCDSIILKNV